MCRRRRRGTGAKITWYRIPALQVFSETFTNQRQASPPRRPFTKGVWKPALAAPAAHNIVLPAVTLRRIPHRRRPLPALAQFTTAPSHSIVFYPADRRRTSCPPVHAPRTRFGTGIEVHPSRLSSVARFGRRKDPRSLRTLRSQAEILFEFRG